MNLFQSKITMGITLGLVSFQMFLYKASVDQHIEKVSRYVAAEICVKKESKVDTSKCWYTHEEGSREKGGDTVKNYRITVFHSHDLYCGDKKICKSHTGIIDGEFPATEDAHFVATIRPLINEQRDRILRHIADKEREAEEERASELDKKKAKKLLADLFEAHKRYKELLTDYNKCLVGEEFGDIDWKEDYDFKEIKRWMRRRKNLRDSQLDQVKEHQESFAAFISAVEGIEGDELDLEDADDREAQLECKKDRIQAADKKDQNKLYRELLRDDYRKRLGAAESQEEFNEILREMTEFSGSIDSQALKVGIAQEAFLANFGFAFNRKIQKQKQQFDVLATLYPAGSEEAKKITQLREQYHRANNQEVAQFFGQATAQMFATDGTIEQGSGSPMEYWRGNLTSLNADNAIALGTTSEDMRRMLTEAGIDLGDAARTSALGTDALNRIETDQTRLRAGLEQSPLDRARSPLIADPGGVINSGQIQGPLGGNNQTIRTQRLGRGGIGSQRDSRFRPLQQGGALPLNRTVQSLIFN